MVGDPMDEGAAGLAEDAFDVGQDRGRLLGVLGLVAEQVFGSLSE
ncbi:hypothetical protein [Nonomuraea gerenzanensis]|nr:hypothetical protein [Nonomuraea gerenzanensis]